MAVELQDMPQGEIRVETGTGMVTDCELASGARNAKVTISATHLSDPVTGWLDTLDPVLGRLVQPSPKTLEGAKVRYRVEVRRKPDFDPTIPIAKVPRRQKVRELVELEVAGRGPVDQPAPEPHHLAAAYEPQPWIRTAGDGRLNLGSWAYEAAAWAVLQAHRLLVAHGQGDSGGITAPSSEAVHRLSELLLAAADGAQARVREGVVARQERSHARARQAVEAALELTPVPFGGSTAMKVEWAGTLASAAGDLLELAVGLDDAATKSAS